MLARRIGPPCIRQCSRRYAFHKVARRRYSTPNGLAQAVPSTASPLGIATSELDQIAPRFEINASQIEVLRSPSAFYETVQDKIRKARKRIYLSTLYVGKTEHELIATIDEALRSNPDLKVSILTDALRGTREAPDPSCASLLASLVASHGDRVEIRMFHTPNLVGLRKRFLPKRINEGWGLQHMKLYGFDDEIILSGANLSNDYFTNRVDRYHVFSSKQLTDYFARIHDAVCSISFQVLPDPYSEQGFLLDWPSKNGCVSPLDNAKAFKHYSHDLLDSLIQPNDLIKTDSKPSKSKTLVYPLGQFTPLFKPNDTSTEYPSLTRVLSLLSTSSIWKHSTWTFTAGYFNMDPSISQLLLAAAPPSKSSTGPCTVITASPWANGFYGSAGISGMLPAAYTHLSRRFLDSVFRAGKVDGVRLMEWRRGTVGEPGGWTYHAKGVWITPPELTAPSTTSSPHTDQKAPAQPPQPDSPGPAITLIGSSNYTKRSYTLDLEVGALIVTDDPELKAKLKEEIEWLQKDAKVVTREELRTDPERKVSWKVRIAMRIVEIVGGAL